MKKLVVLAMLSAFAAPSFAIILNFDDLVGAGAMSAGYGGVADWGGHSYYDSPQDPYTPSSGLERIYKAFGSDGSIKFGQDVVFNGAMIAGASGTGLVTWELYKGGVQVATSAGIDPTNVPQFLASGYGGAVDEVRSGNTFGNVGFYVIDDFNYSAVPEPMSMLALGAGLVAVARRRRRV